MTDANGNTTTYSFVDSVYRHNSGAANEHVPDQGHPAKCERETHVSQFSYRYADGQVTTAIDENNRTTNYAYADLVLDRLTQVTLPADSNNGHASPTNRSHTPTRRRRLPLRQPTTFARATAIPQTATRRSSRYLMACGVTQTQTTNINGPSGGLNYTFMAYDGEGHLSQTSNPTWTGSPSAWTKVFYDAFGRKAIQQQQDGSVLQWCYDGVASIGQTNCHAHIGSSPTDTFVDTADESGNDWQRTSDAFGRLIEVEEPNGKSRTPSLETDYAYNLLNDLLTVTQHGVSPETARSRTYTYDPSRASDSELQLRNRMGLLRNHWRRCCEWIPNCVNTYGVSTNGYDNNSNRFVEKTDARGITVTYAYDALNREYARNYFQNNASTGEPSACHQYDAALTVASGDLYPTDEETAEWMAPAGTCPGNNSPISVIPSNSFSNRTILAHDVGGRITSETQCPSGSS